MAKRVSLGSGVEWNDSTATQQHGESVRRLAEVNAQVPLHQLVRDAPATSWRMAELEGTLRYLRGSTSLEMPVEFRPCFELEGIMWHDPVVG